MVWGLIQGLRRNRFKGAEKQSGSKGTGNEDKKADDKSGNKADGSKKIENEKSGDNGSELKKTDEKESEQTVTKDKGAEKDGETKDKARGGSDLEPKDGTLVQGRKQGGEACDSLSYRCSIEEKSIVACLRVFGNESPDLSLLIQNKGKVPVNVTISATDFVKLQRKQIQVKENGNEKYRKLTERRGDTGGTAALLRRHTGGSVVLN